jgi:hypothetical protein
MTRAETEALEALEAVYGWLFDPDCHERITPVRRRMEATLRFFESPIVGEIARRRESAGLAPFSNP